MEDSENKQDGEYEQVCCMCHRSERTAGKMMRLPINLYVCESCMENVSKLMDEEFGKMSSNGQINYDELAAAYQKQTELLQKANAMKTDDIKENEVNNSSIEASEEEPAKPQEPKELSEEKKEEKETKNKGQIPRFSFINFADFPGELGIGKKNTVKRREKGEKKPLLDLKDIPAPHKIKAQLDEYVVGQEHAKKVMSVAVYNHYKRVATDTMDDIEIEKSNMLMIGPTGCGKTYLVKTLAKLLDVPLAITDATSLTEAGYIGDDIESVVSKLLAAAENDVDKAEQGIIFIDEIDKIAKKQNTNSRDVSGESVQQGMLKLLEGADIEVPVGASSKNAMVPTTTINTKNILFICGGAFPGLEDIITDRIKKQTSIGFNAELKSGLNKDNKDILQKVETQDIRKFGMIPEFVGRLPMVFALEGLDEEMLVKILREPKNAILKQYQKLLELDSVNLKFTDDALVTIAKKAMEKEMGARALRSIIDDFMLDIMYEIPKDDQIGQVTITKEYLEGKGGPIIELREG